MWYNVDIIDCDVIFTLIKIEIFTVPFLYYVFEIWYL